jgi:predicted metal-dependent phosphoesterase TrpH
VIDLHLHTTASDGVSSPASLVSEAAAAGLRVIAVADHDTVEATSAVAEAARAAGLLTVPGVEITAVHRSRDVHVLGYFVEPTPALEALLAGIRRQRTWRAREIARKLAELGVPIDEAALFDRPGGASSVARPTLARALVEAGHVASVAEAFDRYLSHGQPAYEPHTGPAPADVVAAIIEARGVPVLAHPVTSKCDDLIPALAEAGLGAIEVFHSAHDEQAVARYGALAAELGLEATGGSDYHGPGQRRAEFLGKVCVPQDTFLRFCRYASGRASVPPVLLAPLA